MPYLHLGEVLLSPEDQYGNDYTNDGFVVNSDPIDYTPTVVGKPYTDPVVEVHTIPPVYGMAPQVLPEIVGVAQQSWLPLVVIALAVWGLSKGGGGSHKGWD